MPDIFISYAKQDRLTAKRLAATLCEDGWNVFWDQAVEAGADWDAAIQSTLQKARCVLVLWSATSRKSFWVRAEAAESCERDAYVPVRIDDVEPPRLFRHVQAQSIANRVRNGDAGELERLKYSITSRLGEMKMWRNLERVGEDQPVTEAHLHLVHSCWRVDKDSPFGRMPYQIHVIVYGHRSALNRIQSVEYFLPGYPKGHDHISGGPPERLFELKELANGFSIIQANVHLTSQPPGYSKILRLSRFINMSESGPRLFDDFISRVPRKTLE